MRYELRRKLHKEGKTRYYNANTLPMQSQCIINAVPHNVALVLLND